MYDRSHKEPSPLVAEIPALVGESDAWR